MAWKVPGKYEFAVIRPANCRNLSNDIVADVAVVLQQFYSNLAVLYCLYGKDLACAVQSETTSS